MNLTDKQQKFLDDMLAQADAGKSLGEITVETLKQVDDPDVLPAISGAMKQLEAQLETQRKDFEARIAKVQRANAGRNGWHGKFDSEDQARAFGALCLSTMANKGVSHAADQFARKCAELIERDYPDVHKAMDSAADGALIAPEFSDRLVRLVEEYGVFEQAAMTMPMGSDSLTFQRRNGGMSVYVVGENTAGTESDPTYGNVTLTPKELGTLTKVPLTLEEDALAAIGELIATEIAQAFAEASDDDGFLGDGSATYHGFNGVVPVLKAINGVDDGGGLVLADGNNWSEITEANVLTLIGQVRFTRDLRFYCSNEFFWQVLAKLVLAQGGTTLGEATGGPSMQAFGVPVTITPSMPRTEGNSQIPLLCGDLRRAATVGTRRAITVDTSRDYKFAERQLTVLGHRRMAINVHDVGDATDAGPLVGLITAAS